MTRRIATYAGARLTPEQAAIIGAYTRVVLGPFADLHAYAERVLDRPILMHEFGDADVWAELRVATHPDLMALCGPIEDVP